MLCPTARKHLDHLVNILFIYVIYLHTQVNVTAENDYNMYTVFYLQKLPPKYEGGYKRLEEEEEEKKKEDKKKEEEKKEEKKKEEKKKDNYTKAYGKQ